MTIIICLMAQFCGYTVTSQKLWGHHPALHRQFSVNSHLMHADIS